MANTASAKNASFQQDYTVTRRLAGAITVDPELKVNLNVQKTPFTSSSGNFSVAHNLGYSPSLAVIQITNAGSATALVVWQDPLWDATNFNLNCGSSGVKGYIYSIQ